MAFNLFSALMPRQESFTELFCEQAKCIMTAADALRLMLEDGEQVAAHLAGIRRIEMAADAVARRVFIAANRTFNAPIDREDILELAHELDDVVDLIEDTAKGLQRYRLRQPTPEMLAMIEAVQRCSRLLQDAVPLLDHIASRHADLLRLCEEIGRIEGEADDSFDAGLTAIRTALGAGGLGTIEYLDQKELLELLEDVVDKCDDIANTLQSITAKHL
jgi:uncharacterized protein Yka (UPF0111/DUF47 family)